MAFLKKYYLYMKIKRNLAETFVPYWGLNSISLYLVMDILAALQL